jgi:hypothetical protein
VCDGVIHRDSIFESAIFIDTFFNEDLFKRSEEEGFLLFGFFDLKFSTKEVTGTFGGVSKEVGEREEVRFIVINHTTIRRDADFTVGKSIKGVNRLIGRDSGCEVNKDFNLLCSIIIDFTNLYLVPFVGFEDGINHRDSSPTEGDLRNGKGTAVDLVYLRTYFDGTTPFTVIVSGDIHETACLEVGIKSERFLTQAGNAGIQEFIEVMWKYFRGETNCDTFNTLCQEERKLDGKSDRFFIPAIIGILPMGGFGIENCFEGELRKTCLYVSRSSGTVSGKNIPPITLTINKDIFLSELNEGITDRSVAVRVKLHGMPHNVSDLIIPSVVKAFHGVKDTPLYRFKSVVNMRDGAFEDNVGSIVEEPASIHIGEM